MFTKDILFGMNILTLAGSVVMGITLTLDRMGRAGRALRIGLAGTALIFAGLYPPPLMTAERMDADILAAGASGRNVSMSKSRSA